MIKRSNIFISITLALMLAACGSAAGPTTSAPAIGTPMPAPNGPLTVNLPPDMGGVLLVNRSPQNFRVVVSDTVATIDVGNAFLFILPPNTYTLKVYRPDTPAPVEQTEKVDIGKTRFVYFLK
jgi:hypothetical protein